MKVFCWFGSDGVDMGAGEMRRERLRKVLFCVSFYLMSEIFWERNDRLVLLKGVIKDIDVEQKRVSNSTIVRCYYIIVGECL